MQGAVATVGLILSHGAHPAGEPFGWGGAAPVAHESNIIHRINECQHLFSYFFQCYNEQVNRTNEYGGKISTMIVVVDPMPIKWRLNAVMADREIDNSRMNELTGLHVGTISKLRNNPPSRVDMKTLHLLCKALSCQPGELLRYVEEEPNG